MSLQLASLLGEQTQESLSKLFVIRQRMCYHGGTDEERWSGFTWHVPRPPQTGVDPLGGHIRQSL